MKKKSCVLLLFSLCVVLSSCYYSPHYVCELVPEKALYAKSDSGNIFDYEFREYTINENVFLALPETAECWVRNKKQTKARFMFSVYSKSQEFEYTIQSINLIIDGENHDIHEFLIEYYPFDSEVYFPFEKSTIVKNYYISNYHLGFFIFPTPKDKKIDFVVTVSDNLSNQYTFVYKYTIKQIFDLFVSTA